MRVLHVHSGNLFGGVEAVMVGLAGLKGHLGIEHAFALCFEGRLREELESVGAPVHPLGPVRIRRWWTVVRARRALRSVLDGHYAQVAVCHSPWSHALFGGTARRGTGALVFWEHNLHSGRHWLERWARRIRPDLVVANSVAAAAARAVHPCAPVELIHPMVPPPTATAGARSTVRQTLATPEGAFVIVQVSRLEPYKGHGLLIEALALMRDAPGWIAWVVGGPQRPFERQYLSELRRRVEALRLTQRIRFLGERSDVPDVLAAADVFCHPNLAPEPFGVGMVEAMWSGLPVVTTRFGASGGAVDDTCAAVVPTPDPVALAEQLTRIIADTALRARLRAAGPKRAAALCDPALQAPRLRDVLTRVVPPGKRDAP